MLDKQSQWNLCWAPPTAPQPSQHSRHQPLRQPGEFPADAKPSWTQLSQSKPNCAHKNKSKKRKSACASVTNYCEQAGPGDLFTFFASATASKCINISSRAEQKSGQVPAAAGICGKIPADCAGCMREVMVTIKNGESWQSCTSLQQMLELNTDILMRNLH